MPLAAINPSRMDRRAVIMTATESRGDAGTSILTWAELATVWAEWLPRNGREFRAAQASWAEASGLIQIRYRADVTTAARVVLDGKTFEVLDVQEVGRRDALLLIVKTAQPA